MKKFFAGTAMLLTLVLCVAGLNGQSVNGTIGGTVQDSTGAFIPGVTITATNTLTGVATTSVSNESGAYQFSSLQPGTYTISAELPGFVTQRAKDYQLGGSAQARLNFTMQVASSSTSIDVTVNADALLTTSSNSIGAVLPEYKVRDLPLPVRDVFGLVAMTAGCKAVGAKPASCRRLWFPNTTRDGMNVSDGRYERRMVGHVYESRSCRGESRRPGRCAAGPRLAR
jgi:hypothetical protein